MSEQNLFYSSIKTSEGKKCTNTLHHWDCICQRHQLTRKRTVVVRVAMSFEIVVGRLATVRLYRRHRARMLRRK